MKIIFNPDSETVEALRKALKAKDGFCPCRVQRIPENICMCEEFRAQIADPEFEGFGHCKLYYTEK